MPTLEDDSGSDEDSEADGAPRDNETARATDAAAATAGENAPTSSTSPPSSPARSRLRHNGGGGDSVMSNSDRDIDVPHLSSDDAPRPPSSSPDLDRDEAAIELDALLEAEAASHASTHNNATSTTTDHAWKGASNGDDAIAMDEDEDLWDALNTDMGTNAVAAASAPATVTAMTTPPPAPHTMDDDQEMWDIMHELEQEKAKETVAQPPDPVQVPQTASDSPQPETDDLDDLYL